MSKKLDPRTERLQVPVSAAELSAVRYLAQSYGMSAAALARYAMLRLAEERERELRAAVPAPAKSP